jgi:hypothetical protein
MMPTPYLDTSPHVVCFDVSSSPPRQRNSAILGMLHALATHILNAPLRAFGQRASARRLADDIAAAQERCGQYPIGDNAVMLAMCLVNIVDNPREPRWQVIASLLLPWVGDDVRAALRADLEEMRDTR